MTKTITCVPYMYRDGDNNKAWLEHNLRDEISAGQRAHIFTLLDSLNYGEPIGFLPELIGWNHPVASQAWDIDSEIDHHWCELDVRDIYTREESDEVYDGLPQSVDDFIGKLIAAHNDGWDVTKIPEANLQFTA